MMVLVFRMLYFLEGLEVACLMVYVVLLVVGRFIIIRIYKNRIGKGCCEIVVVCGIVLFWFDGVYDDDFEFFGCFWKMEVIVFILVLLLGVKDIIRFVRF